MRQVEILRDIPYGSGAISRQVLDLYLPNERENAPILVFFHGGGFIYPEETKAVYAKFAQQLAEAGVACVCPEYRIYPDCRFPDFIEDAALATAWTKQNMAQYGIRSRRLFLGGHSAGGHQAMLLLFDERYLKAVDMEPSELAGGVFLSGQPTTHFSVLQEKGLDPRLTIIDEAAPMYHVRPLEVPLLITVAEDEIENRILQTELLLASLKTMEYRGEITFKEYFGYDHDNYILPDGKQPAFPCAAQEEILRFIERHA